MSSDRRTGTEPGDEFTGKAAAIDGPPTPDFQPLIDVALLTLGYLMGKEGIGAYPVAPLARALQGAGVVDCTYVNAIVDMANEKGGKRV
jgi:hypothetical protein